MTADNGSKAIRKACKYFIVLAGHEVDGLRPGQIATAAGVSPATVTRDIKTLVDEGIVELVPGLSDRWRLGPKVVQIAVAHMQGVDRASGRVAEVKQRYSREFK